MSINFKKSLRNVAVVVGLAILIAFPTIGGLALASLITLLFAPTFLGISLVGAAFVLSLKAGIMLSVIIGLLFAIILKLKFGKEKSESKTVEGEGACSAQ